MAIPFTRYTSLILAILVRKLSLTAGLYILLCEHVSVGYKNAKGVLYEEHIQNYRDYPHCSDNRV